MKICPSCGARLEDSVSFCTQCGKQVPVIPVQAPKTTPVNQTQPGNTVPVQPNYGQNTGYQGYPGYQGNTGYQGKPGYQPNPGYHYAPPVDPYDHTSEFDAKDISDNKVVCMLIYLAGYLGMLVALLLAGSSKYVGFHLRQALKIEVANILLAIVAAVGVILLFIPTIVAGALMVALYVVKFICFFQICKGQAKEAYIVRSLGFMK